MKSESMNENCIAPYTIPFMPLMPKYAHAYVPFQTLTNVYPPEKGLVQGTIFPELDAPYGSDPEYTVDA
jgi:hypothetical protein